MHAEQEPPFFGQDVFEAAAVKAATVTAAQHQAAAATAEQRAISTLHGTMDKHAVAVLLAPTGGPAWPIEPRDDFWRVMQRASRGCWGTPHHGANGDHVARISAAWCDTYWEPVLRRHAA